MSVVDRHHPEAADIDLLGIPHRSPFPVELYAEILASGKAAVSPRRYDSRAECKRDIEAVASSLRYHQQFNPDFAPVEFGTRTWQSREDGRWRWAVVPEKTLFRRR